MNSVDKISIWRKVAMSGCFLIIITCVILLNYMDNVIKLPNLRGWGYEQEECRIGNISKLDSRGQRLDKHYVNIGNHIWYSNKLEDKDHDDNFGDLIKIYTHSPSNDEYVSLWVYDITPKLKSEGISRDLFYQHINDSLLKDTTDNIKWKSTNAIYPLSALETGAYMIITDSVITRYVDKFIVLGNDRVYVLYFNRNPMGPFDLYHKKCLSLLKDIDFLAYHQWEEDYYIYREKSKQRFLVECLIYTILFVSGLCIFFLAVNKLGSKNIYAKNLALYVIVLYLLSLLVYYVTVIVDNSGSRLIFYCLIFDILPSIIILPFIIRFLAGKSHQDYCSYFLLPEWLSSNLKLNNEYRRRLAMIFLLYPFFITIPLPFVRQFALIFYMLPVFLVLGIIRIAMWVREGKGIDVVHNAQRNSASLYCRYCGKLIDADSGYCRYCGKKL